MTSHVGRRASSMIAAFLVTTSVARAKPSRWDRIRDPDLARGERALALADAERVPKDLSMDGLAELPSFASLLALRSATVLELAGGGAIHDPDVWFYLGDALIVADRGRDEEGRALLEKALAARPNSPVASLAWAQIGIASDRLKDEQGARHAYSEALRVEWNRSGRAELYIDRAESNMALGDLGAARKDYLAALAASIDAETNALAGWGLAVALARDGDVADALRVVRDPSRPQFRDLQGNSITALELPYVFFTPAYELYYYRALAAMAAAKDADDERTRRSELEWASREWAGYVSEARLAGDRFADGANALWVQCRQALDRKPSPSVGRRRHRASATK